MVVLVTCKNEEDPIKIEGARVVQQCYIIHQFLRCSMAANSLMGDGILTKFKLIWAFFQLSFLSARMNMIYSKLKALEWSQHFSHYKSMGIFKTLKGG